MDGQPYHQTEIALQQQSGRRAFAQALAPRISAKLDADVSRLLPSLPFVILGTLDQNGAPWASILTGREGFILCEGDARIHIRAEFDDIGELAQHLSSGGDIGVIAIDLSRRYRYRINGKATLVDGGISVDIAQCYRNCPQFIHARQASYILDNARGKRSISVRFAALPQEAINLVGNADTFFIATHGTGEPFEDPRLGADVSHRGGSPGFVSVTKDGQRLAFPDYIGNFIFNTLGNIQRYPRCGLLFIDFASNTTLQVTGTVHVDWDLDRAAGVPGAQRMIDVEITGVIMTRHALPLAWTLIEAAPDLKRFQAVRLKERAPPQVLEGRDTPDHFRRFVVTAIVDEADEIRSFYLKPVSGALKSFRPGQYLPVMLFPEGSNRPIIRHYSLSKYDELPDEYRIGVRRVVKGRAPSGSSHMHDDLTIGSEVLVGSPSGTFTLATEARRPVALISAGIGVTPILCMFQALVAQKLDRRVWFIHGTRHGASQAYASEVRRISDRLPNVEAHFRFSRARLEQRLDFPGREFDSEGRVDAELVKSIISKDAEVYICGPSQFMHELRRDLSAWGIPEGRIHIEAFSVGAEHDVRHALGAAGASVSFSDFALETTWSGDHQSLLELAESNGLLLPFSCRTGSCGSCEHALISGQVTYPGELAFQPKPDHVLLCCAQPTSDVVIASRKAQ